MRLGLDRRDASADADSAADTSVTDISKAVTYDADISSSALSGLKGLREAMGTGGQIAEAFRQLEQVTKDLGAAVEAENKNQFSAGNSTTALAVATAVDNSLKSQTSGVVNSANAAVSVAYVSDNGGSAAAKAKDAADLTRAALEIKPGWIVFPRPKSGIGRKCPLWPETVEALAAVAKVRPKALLEADENLVFVTRHGNRWVRQPEHENKRTVNIDAFAGAMTKILRKVELSHRVTPYQLRRTFRTIADEIQDEPAIDVIIGHATEGMAAKYRQRIDDSRLEKIVGHVRKWLLAGKPPATEEAKVLA